MMDDPKKIAIGLIAKLHPQDEGGSPSSDMDDQEGEKHALMQEFIHAVHAGDPAAASDSLEAFIHCVEKQPHEEYPIDEEEEKQPESEE